MFWLVRLITFIVGNVVLAIAGCMTADSRKKLPDHQYSKKTRIITWCIGIALCIATILEMIFSNFNEFTLMKVAGCFFIWNFSMVGCFVEGACRNELTNKIYSTAKVMVGVSILAVIVGFIYAITYEHPAWQETQLLSTTELVATNDSYQIEGRGSSGLFIHSFAISENGVYRYYYRTENGGIRQDYVDAENTTIYYIENGETPHLDRVGLFEYWYRKSENQDVLESKNVYNWYELYVPAGSLVESYVFDLQ